MVKSEHAKRYIEEKYPGRRISLREWHGPLEFGDVVSGMGEVVRTLEPVHVETLVEGISIACRPANLDRWLVSLESGDGARLTLGCTDMWEVISPTARRALLDVPILLQRGEKLSVRLESRIAEARCAVVQVNATQVVASPPRSRNY